MAIVALVVSTIILALPFFAGEGEKSWRRRPIAVLVTVLVAAPAVVTEQ